MMDTREAKRRRLAYVLIVAFISIVTVVIGGILYTQHVAHQSDLRWCELLIPLDDAYQKFPLSDELGQKMVAAVHDLRINFGCLKGGS